MLTKTLLYFNLINTCPVIEPLAELNTTEYIRATWYIQQQQVTGYQPRETLYCVAQTLNESNRTVPFYDGPVISVFNYGRINGVNGTLENPNNYTLCARQPNSSNPAEIINAPCFLPNVLAGPYWVLAAGPSSYNYSWAIVSGGPPTVRYADGNCSTKLTGTNGAGLWLFTREPFGEIADMFVNKMRLILRNIGYTTSLLINVTQRGCNYSEAFIKY